MTNKRRKAELGISTAASRYGLQRKSGMELCTDVALVHKIMDRE
jgi:hypothetical protein